MLNADLKEFQFASDFDELVISAVLAVPSGDINGIVQIVHGMNEHKERYYPFMDYLAEQGFITVIHDNRGHGKSIVEPDDLGYMFRKGGEGFVSDIAQLNARIRAAYPNVPVFMAASGLGAAGARCFLKEHDGDINGLVLLGTICHCPFSPAARIISSVASKRPGSRFRAHMAQFSLLHEICPGLGIQRSGMNQNPFHARRPFFQRFHGREKARGITVFQFLAVCGQRWHIAPPQPASLSSPNSASINVLASKD